MTDNVFRYPSKAAYAKRYFSIDATGFLPDGVTITSATLAISLYEFSTPQTDDSGTMVSGVATVNTEAVTILGNLIDIGKAATCLVVAGTPGIEYVATWQFQFSDSVQRDAVSANFTVH